MKPIRIIFLVIIIHQLSISNCNAQAGEWTWISGDNILNSTGNYGTVGVPSPANQPASRYACGYWTDTAGNFWIYSGVNAFDDLWKFNPQTTEWTWMAGSNIGPGFKFIHFPDTIGTYHPDNTPGALNWGMQTWVTPDNHLWLFGGLYGDGGGTMNNNLWQYNPAINQWAWMGDFGPTNYGTMGVGDKTTVPGGRQEGNSAWVDADGNLWLFGGCNGTYLSYNDMWMYNVSTGIWTWMSGNEGLEDTIGSYYVKGVAWDHAYPSARSTNLFWKDDVGNFWLAGGTDHESNYMYQDVWRFNPLNLDWTWVSGVDGNDTSIYGANCIADAQDQDGPRYENRAVWKLCSDFVITYSGFGSWADSSYTGNNDLWRYKISAGEWIKLNSWPITGNYGTRNIASSNNFPPSRIGGVGFKGRDNSLWLFGGQNNNGFFNDMWKYVPDTTCTAILACERNCHAIPPVITASDTLICENDSARLCATGGYASYQWNTGVTGTGNCIFVSQAGNYYVAVTDTAGCTAVSNKVAVAVWPVAGPEIIVQGDTLSSFGAVSYQWYFNDNIIPGDTSAVYIAPKTGYYSVQTTDINGCAIRTPDAYITVAGIDNLSLYENISIYPNPSVASVQCAVSSELLGSVLEVFDEQGRVVMKDELRTTKYEVTADSLPSGVYYLRISNDKVSVVRKLVKM